jgi:hypothetical protein
MDVLYVLLLLAAFVLFLIAAFVRRLRVNLVALGAACWVLVILIQHARALD